MERHNTLIIVAHPDLEHSVINKAWMEALTGHATIHSLCDAYPTGTPIDVAHERALVERHDRVILQFPLYWYSAPAILKQWTDEVFGEGWAFEGGSQKHTLATFLTPYEGLAAFARADYIGHHAFYDTYSDTVAERLPANCEAYLRFALQ